MIPKMQHLLKNTVLITGGVFLLLGLLTRFYAIDHPKEIVFDEFHFFHFVTEYEQGEYFFDIHPPLGKLILWGNAKLYGIEEMVEKQSVLSEEERTIGSQYSEEINMAGIRSIPALFGALLVPLMFFFAYFLTKSIPISSIAGVFTLLSPAFLVESQYVLMDSMLMFFVVLSGFFAMLYYKTPHWKWWIAGTVATTLAVSIKWTGMSAIGIMGLVWLAVLIREKTWKKNLLKALFFWITLPLFYIFTFWVHFVSLPFSGEGDAFHTAEFRKNIIGSFEYKNEAIEPKGFFWNASGEDWIPERIENPYYHPDNETSKKYVRDWENWKFYGTFWELNRQMGDRSAAIRNEHPFASRPEDWVKGEKSIYLWNKESTEEENQTMVGSMWNASLGKMLPTSEQCREVFQQQLHLFPNTFLWKILPFTTLLLGLIFCIACIRNVRSWIQKEKIPHAEYWKWGMITLAIVANILPFVLIERPQFLYHAFEGVLFAILGFVLVILLITENLPHKNKIQWGIFGFLCTLSVLYFVIEIPLVYGFPFHDCVGQSLFRVF